MYVRLLDIILTESSICFTFYPLVEERRHFGSSFYHGGGYLSSRIGLYLNSVSTFQLNHLIISGDISENPGWINALYVWTLLPKIIALSYMTHVLDGVILSVEKLNQMTTRNCSWLMTSPGFALLAYLKHHWHLLALHCCQIFHFNMAEVNTRLTAW